MSQAGAWTSSRASPARVASTRVRRSSATRPPLASPPEKSASTRCLASSRAAAAGRSTSSSPRAMTCSVAWDSSKNVASAARGPSGAWPTAVHRPSTAAGQPAHRHRRRLTRQHDRRPGALRAPAGVPARAGGQRRARRRTAARLADVAADLTPRRAAGPAATRSRLGQLLERTRAAGPQVELVRWPSAVGRVGEHVVDGQEAAEGDVGRPPLVVRRRRPSARGRRRRRPAPAACPSGRRRSTTPPPRR